MARAQGARAPMALAFQTICVSGYARASFASGSEQPLISSEIQALLVNDVAEIR